MTKWHVYTSLGGGGLPSGGFLRHASLESISPEIKEEYGIQEYRATDIIEHYQGRVYVTLTYRGWVICWTVLNLKTSFAKAGGEKLFRTKTEAISNIGKYEHFVEEKIYYLLEQERAMIQAKNKFKNDFENPKVSF